MTAFANDIVLFAFAVGCLLGGIAASIGWAIWAWRAMNPRK